MVKSLFAAALSAMYLVASFIASASEDVQQHSALIVTNVVLGSHATARNTVAIPKSLFKASETIYLSVETQTVNEDLLPGTLAVNWTYGSGNRQMVVHSESIDVPVTGQNYTLFEITKPDGWPIGNYQVELFSDGRSIRKIDYSVR